MPPSSRHPATSTQGQAHQAHRRSPEAFQSLYRRNEAVIILQSYEMLSWYSFMRSEVSTFTSVGGIVQLSHTQSLRPTIDMLHDGSEIYAEVGYQEVKH